MPKFIDLQGRRFGRLIVLYRDMTGHSNDRHTYWVCRCDCGRLKTVRSDDLRSGLVVSCGCYHAEVSSKIGSYVNLKHGSITVTKDKALLIRVRDEHFNQQLEEQYGCTVGWKVSDPKTRPFKFSNEMEDWEYHG